MIPPNVASAGVMLAKADTSLPAEELARRLSAEENRWTFDIKWDGVRCLAFVDQGSVRLVNRQGSDITHQYPEVVAYLAEAYATDSVVLDGEMICFDPALGYPTFNRIQRRNAQSNRKVIAQLAEEMPATLMVFDILYHNGADLRRVMLQGRLLLLEKVVERLEGERVMASTYSDDGMAMWKQVKALGLEGLIAKRKSSLYMARKDSAWVKIKPTRRVTAIAVGWEYGKKNGARQDTLGALFINLLDGDRLVDAGKVGTGFKLAELQPLIDRIEAWKADPPNNPPLLVEVEFQDLLDSGKLRFPRYLGTRDDILWTDCTTEQLENA